MLLCRCRSAAVVIGYLIKHRRWRLCDSYKWVKEHRAATQLAPGDPLLQPVPPVLLPWTFQHLMKKRRAEGLALVLSE